MRAENGLPLPSSLVSHVTGSAQFITCHARHPVYVPAAVAERDLVRALTVGIGRYYGAGAPALGSR